MTQDVPEQQSQETQGESAAQDSSVEPAQPVPPAEAQSSEVSQAPVPEPKSAEVQESPIQEPTSSVEVPLSPSPETPSPAPAAVEPAPAAAPVEPQPQEPPPAPEPQAVNNLKTKAISLLPLALARRREKKAKKLEKILNHARAKERITNDEVQKLVGVSDRTAQRYLKDLEHQGKLKAVILGGNLTHYILP